MAPGGCAINVDQSYGGAIVNPQKHIPILVIGGGSAAAETVLQLNRHGVTSGVTVVAEHERIVPGSDLVYTPFGIEPRAIPLAPLLKNVDAQMLLGKVTDLDISGHTVALPDGESASWGVLISAIGASPQVLGGCCLRDASRARGLAVELDALVRACGPAGTGRSGSVVFRMISGCAWPLRAYEMAQLLHHWLLQKGVRDRISITVASEESSLLSRFGLTASDQLDRLFEKYEIEVMTGLPPGRVDAVSGDVVVNASPLAARWVPGMVPRRGDFWEPDPTGAIAPDVYIVGDATSYPIRLPLIANRQAEVVAAAITGQTAPKWSEPVTAEMLFDKGSLHLTFPVSDPFSGDSHVRADIHFEESWPDHFSGSLLSTMGGVPADDRSELFFRSTFAQRSHS